jgi:hypothetical protein
MLSAVIPFAAAVHSDNRCVALCWLLLDLSFVLSSVNEVICHGIPDCRPLEDGDIVNLDISAYYRGYAIHRVVGVALPVLLTQNSIVCCGS